MPKDHFRTRGFIEGGIIQNADDIAIDIGALPPFLRTLLVADGTVTKSLEAFFWEKIIVQTITQNDHQLDQDIAAIEAQAEDHVLKRKVVLRGETSDRIYAYATSYLQLETLNDEIKQNLLAEKIGIGELLREIGLETYREIIDVGKEQFTPMTTSSETSQEVIFRTYVIHIGGKPTIQITERFPLSVFHQAEPN